MNSSSRHNQSTPRLGLVERAPARTPRAVPLLGQLYQVAGPNLTHPWDANGFLLMGAEPTLIDCGSVLGAPALRDNLATFGLELGDIHRVIATHAHWDHLSGAVELQAAGAEVWLHAAEVYQAELGDPDRTASFLYDQQFPKLRVDRVLQGGEVVQLGEHTLELHHTPGHSPGGMSFVLQQGKVKVLFAGDTLWGGYHHAVGSDMQDWQRSLELLVSLEPAVMTVGHAAPGLIFDATAKLREAQQQLGVYMNPWFKPFHIEFQY